MQTLTSLARSLPHVLGAVIGPKDNLMYPSNSWKILGQTSIINNNNLSAWRWWGASSNKRTFLRTKAKELKTTTDWSRSYRLKPRTKMKWKKRSMCWERSLWKAEYNLEDIKTWSNWVSSELNRNRSTCSSLGPLIARSKRITSSQAKTQWLDQAHIITTYMQKASLPLEPVRNEHAQPTLCPLARIYCLVEMVIQGLNNTMEEANRQVSHLRIGRLI